MRKDRGKRVEKDEWVYGYYFRREHNDRILHYIHDGEFSQYQVDFETVGQYTGLKDKNNKEIYEGDIVKGEIEFQGQSMKIEGQIKYTHCRFMIAEYNCSLFQFSNDFAGSGFWLKVIGNKYKNPEG